MGTCTLKITCAQLGAIFDYFIDFDCKYLRKESRYRQAENGGISYNPSHVRGKNSVNFVPLTTKFGCLISTHPGSQLRVCIG